MKIDGKAIAAHIFHDLQKQIDTLKQKNIIPHLAIILVGDNPASVSYVKRKKAKAEELRCSATIYHLQEETTENETLELINNLNDDPNVHGIIVQRPLPHSFNLERINQAVLPEKDIDAFHPDTPFEMPLAKAALLLLEYVYKQEKTTKTFTKWLQAKRIAVIGKGETGGGPIITLLKKYGVTPTIIDSKTHHPKDITKASDVIFSAVGKSNILTQDMLKNGVILISVGQHKQNDGKFHGDYEEQDVEHIASWYSPTPGGVGPVNVASLLQNLIEAVKKQTV